MIFLKGTVWLERPAASEIKFLLLSDVSIRGKVLRVKVIQAFKLAFKHLFVSDSFIDWRIEWHVVLLSDLYDLFSKSLVPVSYS